MHTNIVTQHCLSSAGCTKGAIACAVRQSLGGVPNVHREHPHAGGGRRGHQPVVRYANFSAAQSLLTRLWFVSHSPTFRRERLLSMQLAGAPTAARPSWTTLLLQTAPCPCCWAVSRWVRCYWTIVYRAAIGIAGMCNVSKTRRCALRLRVGPMADTLLSTQDLVQWGPPLGLPVNDWFACTDKRGLPTCPPLPPADPPPPDD
jgi:hypothetical protein